MERYDITIQMYSADASGTQYVWGKVPAEEGDFVLYADAQATIAALEQRVKELKQWYRISLLRILRRCGIWMKCSHEPWMQNTNSPNARRSFNGTMANYNRFVDRRWAIRGSKTIRRAFLVLLRKMVCVSVSMLEFPVTQRASQCALETRRNWRRSRNLERRYR